MPFHKILVKALEWHGQISNASEEKNMESSETIPRSHIADVPSSCLRRWTYRRTEERLCPSRCRSDRSSSTHLQFTFISDQKFSGQFAKRKEHKRKLDHTLVRGEIKTPKHFVLSETRAPEHFLNDKWQLTAGNAEGAGLLVEGEEGEVHGASADQGHPAAIDKMRDENENSGTWGWIWCTFPTTLSFSSSPSHIILSPEDRNRDGWLSKMFLSLKKGRRKCGVILLLM